MNGDERNGSTMRRLATLIQVLLGILALVGIVGAALVFWGNFYWARASEFRTLQSDVQKLKGDVSRVERKVDQATILILQGQLADLQMQLAAVQSKPKPMTAEDHRRQLELTNRIDAVSRQLQQIILRNDGGGGGL